MEACTTYKPWHDKTTGKTFLKFDQSKCLHYYFYFIDKELGLCYLRVPTCSLFRLQFYMNGLNLLAHKLDKEQIHYTMLDNAFLEISDVDTAQKLSDRTNPEGLHKVLDVFAKRYSPVPDSLGLGYTWTVQQIERPPFSVSVSLITVSKRLGPTITHAFSARESNTIWVMYQLKCMINLAVSYGLSAPAMISVLSAWCGKSTIGTVPAAFRNPL